MVTRRRILQVVDVVSATIAETTMVVLLVAAVMSR